MTGFFDATGREYTPAELRARRAAFDAATTTARVVVELLDANGQRVSMVAPEFQEAIARSIVSARIIPDAPEAVPDAAP